MPFRATVKFDATQQLRLDVDDSGQVLATDPIEGISLSSLVAIHDEVNQLMSLLVKRGWVSIEVERESSTPPA